MLQDLSRVAHAEAVSAIVSNDGIVDSVSIGGYLRLYLGTLSAVPA